MNVWRPSLRSWSNRVIVAALGPPALANIVVVGHFRPRAARLTAQRWIHLITGLVGVRIDTTIAPLSTTSGLTVFVANHSSPIDIVAMLVAVPEATFVAGADLFGVPLLAGTMRAMGVVPVDRKSRNGTQMQLPAGTSPAGMKLVVFPEGGIAPVGQRRPFHRSAFALAVKYQGVIVPVAIHGAGAALPPRSRLGIRPGRIEVQFLERIPTAGASLVDRYRLCAQAEDQITDALGPADGGRSNRSGVKGRVYADLVTLVDEKYISVTTTRLDGRSVATPTWVVALDDGKLGFWTSSASGKAKRLAHNSRVTIQPCDARGRIKAGSSPTEGTAEIVSGPPLDVIRQKIEAKYGMMTKVAKVLGTLGAIAKRKRIPYGDRGVIITVDP